jgi:DNA mismatch endonuclease (patch repair protein)
MRAVPRSAAKPEIVLRKRLHAFGLRHVLGGRGLPGSPDLVLPRWTAAVFVHGCFWHRHPNCRYTTMPSTRREFWQAKFEANVARDSTVRAALLSEGWRVATFWECTLRKPQRVEIAADLLAAWLQGDAPDLEIGETDVVAETHGGWLS